MQNVSVSDNKLKKRKSIFEDQDIIYNLAHIFGGDNGEKKAKKILDEANNMQDINERKQFIEQKIKE